MIIHKEGGGGRHLQKKESSTEKKLKGKGEVSLYGVHIIFANVQEMERPREGVAILLNNVWHSAVVKSGCVSSKILWIKFKF